MANNTSDDNKILLAGADGKSDLDNGFGSFSSNDELKKYQTIIDDAKRERSMNKDFVKDMEKVYEEFKNKGVFNEDGSFNENRAMVKGNVRDLKSWSNANPSLILEVADNAKVRLWERKNKYEDAGENFVVKEKVETAEDDRVLGIPYAQAMAGDRVFIINGKIFTGWALYFSLSSIKSPEDYARNVDLVYNVPYLFASIQLKAQLGLGCGFDVNYGAESDETAEEKLTKKFLFDKLKINTQKLVKTGFHLFSYGNSYWAIRRDANGNPDKITILQPERLKIFLDPMTTRIMFYIYLPPIIGGTTIASYPSDGKVNPNILTGMTLSYPTPIVMHPEDVLHFKINDFTEYPFGFSDVKTCLDPATARLDVNILAPIIFKKYSKPMVHWALNTEGMGPKQVEDKKTEMVNMLENMEPGSDPVTTDRWKPTIISVTDKGQAMFNLTGDMDTQIFAATGAPETYFKSKGSTDRMISEQDKTFLSRLKIPQEIVADQIEEKLIKPRIYYELCKKQAAKKLLGEADQLDDFLKSFDSWMASEPKIPKVKWKEIFKQDETQLIANTVVLLNNGIIDKNRAAAKLGIITPSDQGKQDLYKTGIDDPISHEAKINEDIAKAQQEQKVRDESGKDNNPNMQNQMQQLRGQAVVTGQKDQSSRNINDVKDPSQLGGSRYAQHETHGKQGDLSQKSSGLKAKPPETADNAIKVGSKIDVVDGVIIKYDN
jgi:hypothetical protein